MSTTTAPPAFRLDVDATFARILPAVKPQTMVDPLRLHALYESVRYVVANRIPGDLVECGVWRGGCCMLMALTLRALGDETRRLWMYDTFTGMDEPGPEDVSADGAKVAAELWSARRSDDGGSDWCRAALADARTNMHATGYPTDRIELVVGRTQDTIPHRAPERIALLRLDTDWYDSTRHEMAHLWPRLAPGGAFLSDDYGHWSGHRRAIDEHFAAAGVHPLLTRVTCGAVGVKPG